MFITLEGPEGSGKTTCMHALHAWLTHQKKQVITTFEPGGTPEGALLRTLMLGEKSTPPVQMLNPASYHFSSLSCCFLMLAARHEHLQKCIRPALQEGKWVLCDRFMDSTVAYQGYGAGIDLAFLEACNHQVVGKTQPDITFFFDICPREALSRKNQASWNRFDALPYAFHARVYQGYKILAKHHASRIYTLNASASFASVLAQAQAILSPLLTASDIA